MPYFYDEINRIDGTYQPSNIIHQSKAYKFWERALFQRACTVIDIKKMPEEWKGAPEDFFKYILYRRGFLAVINTAEYGLTFQPCAFGGGRDLYYQPTHVIISNPHFKTNVNRFKIGVDCELLKLTPDYCGIWDIISYYAQKLATMDNAVDMAIINSKFAYMLGARDKNTREALKKGMDKINAGEPFVIFDTNLMKNQKDDEESVIFLDRKVRESYILTDLLQDFNTILNDFDKEIGLPIMASDKKERENVTETIAKTIDSGARSSTWINTLKSSCEKVNAMFGDILDFELHYKSVTGGGGDAIKSSADLDL